MLRLIATTIVAFLAVSDSISYALTLAMVPSYFSADAHRTQPSSFNALSGFAIVVTTCPECYEEKAIASIEEVKSRDDVVRFFAEAAMRITWLIRDLVTTTDTRKVDPKDTLATQAQADQRNSEAQLLHSETYEKLLQEHTPAVSQIDQQTPDGIMDLLASHDFYFKLNDQEDTDAIIEVNLEPTMSQRWQFYLSSPQFDPNADFYLRQIIKYLQNEGRLTPDALESEIISLTIQRDVDLARATLPKNAMEQKRSSPMHRRYQAQLSQNRVLQQISPEEAYESYLLSEEKALHDRADIVKIKLMALEKLKEWLAGDYPIK